MFPEVIRKRDDRWPPLIITVGNVSDGFTADPTAATVNFTMVKRSDHASIKVDDKAASIQNVSLNDDETYRAELVYTWAVGDLDTVEEYDGEFTVTIGGTPARVPEGKKNEDGTIEDKFIPLTVVERIGT